ncbi:MAG: hypothetical protein HQL48_10380 [Gammaproteobacteria bacterium]|nr:hypothetical protein [Gammaproteobacteria bacterium]
MQSVAIAPKAGLSLKEGPVTYQSEDSLLDEDRLKKDLTLSELNHLFKLYLGKRNTRLEDISILAQFSVIFNDPRFAEWHEMDRSAQDLALTELVRLPQIYDELIAKVGTIAGDAQIIKSVVKDAYQNAIDSFSHAAFMQRKYQNMFPGFKVILFLDQINHKLNLIVVDNGFGEKVIKPKKSHTGQTYDDDIFMRLIDWLFRSFVDKKGEVERRIAYTGGQGLGLKKIGIELRLDYDLHFFSTGAVFDLKLKSYF